MDTFHKQMRRVLDTADKSTIYSTGDLSELEITVEALVDNLAELRTQLNGGDQGDLYCVLEPNFFLWNAHLLESAVHYAVTEKLFSLPYLEKTISELGDTFPEISELDTTQKIMSLVNGLPHNEPKTSKGDSDFSIELVSEEQAKRESLRLQTLSRLFAGLRLEDLRSIGRALCASPVPGFLNEDEISLLQRLNQEDFHTIVLTSSMYEMTSAALAALNISCNTVAGMKLRYTEEGRLLPGILPPVVYGAERMAILKQLKYSPKTLCSLVGSISADTYPLLAASRLVVLASTVPDTALVQIANSTPVVRLSL